MSNRNRRVSELLKREISDILHTRYQKESIGITITGVDVSPDHSNAKVFYSTIEQSKTSHRAQGFLDRLSGKIRHELGRRIILKRMPSLKFEYDQSIEYGERIDQLIDELDIPEDEEGGEES